MKPGRKIEVAASLTLVTTYVVAAHLAAEHKLAHALLSGGGNASALVVAGLAALVVVRVLVVVVLPPLIAARLGVLAFAWLGERRARQASSAAAMRSS